MSLSGLAVISEAYARPSKPNNEDGDERRVQEDSACDAEGTDFFQCVPAGRCFDCFNTTFAEALAFEEDEGVTCAELESRLCAIPATCGCGCETESEIYFSCLVTDNSDCDILDCPIAAPVSAPTISVETPFPTASEPCYVCGMESMIVEPGLTTIFNGEEYACEDLQDWGTQRLFDAVTCQLTTLLVTNDCNCSPATAPVSSPVASPTATDEETPFPTYAEICYVCNDPDLTVTPGLTTTIDDVEYSCELVEEFGLDRLAGGTFCQLLTLLVPKDCNCVPREGGGLPAMSAAPSSSPTYSEPCYVCGDPESRVDPDRTVTIGDEVRSCENVQILMESTQVASPLECNILSDLVADSCNCQSPETSTPVATPTTDSTTSSPVASVVIPPTTPPPPPSPPTPRDILTEAPVGSAVAKSSEGGGGGALYALAALALVPIAAGLFLYFRSKKPEDAPKIQKPTNDDGFSEPELNDTVPDSPQRAYYNPQATRAPAPRHHHGDGSATASMRSEDDHIHRPPPVAAVAVASLQSGWSGGGGSANDSLPSYDDPARRSVGDVSSGSGQSRDPPATPAGMAARNIPAPPAPRTDPIHGSGNYMPDVKDQCRPVATEVEEDIVVDEVVAVDPDDHRKKAPIDP